MSAGDEKQSYIDDMARERGYVLDYHKVMAKHDFDVLTAANNLVYSAYLRQRTLDRKTKELIFIVSLTVIAHRNPTSKAISESRSIWASPLRRSWRPSKSACPRPG